ncbi:hypothetical protein [Winogradskyella flava]|uniref:Uncharacterized protein n=1 Tax=Winogradskyella flava TaxID=1884876 RepID=A0A842IU08_9FLAO|nr:hypothetical protein [Winogradskyella flava]MBC2845639.1 hypothetical protein [Winogradskyella flava]
MKKNQEHRNTNGIGASKTLKMLVLVVTIAFSSVLSASTNPVEKAEPTSVTETVGDLLKNPDFQLNEDIGAMVEIVINQNDEMVVLSVDTKSETVEKYIKSRLNYKKISKEVLDYRKSFKIPVRILKSKF